MKSKECDLVMKGGLTSGIVYPKAVSELSETYEFRNIGGTSAGAIAAAFTAAAEYHRQQSPKTHDGFNLLDTILPEQIGKDMLKLFQPDKVHKRTFKFLLRFLAKKKGSGIVWFGIKNITMLRKLLKLKQSLSESNYGLCSGKTISGYGVDGLIDWLNDWIEQVAGRAQLVDSEGPLTFKMLDEKNVNLKIITTNVSKQQSVTLPFNESYYAKASDLSQVLPDNIVDYLVKYDNDLEGDKPKKHAGFIRLPKGLDLPVIMAVRMSLSFPVLLAAVPLYKPDWSRKIIAGTKEYEMPQKCWFSDGGISSNFPIHLFDSLFPSRPTFGVSLGEFNKDRNKPDVPEGVPGFNRIFLPQNAKQGKNLPIDDISDVFSFLGSVFYSAQNWQDKSQIKLPGYKERIISISLKETEGGMNLKMPKNVIDGLSKLGDLAGQHLSSSFDFDSHRWQRILSSYAAFEKEFGRMVCAYKKEKGVENVRDFLLRYRAAFIKDEKIADSYSPRTVKEIDELIRRIDQLIEVAMDWDKSQIRSKWGSGTMPRPTSALRLMPNSVYGDDQL